MQQRFAHVSALVGLLLLAASTAVADPPARRALRPVHTYSIVAHDAKTGQLGAAVQSHWFKVDDVIWVEAGVGAVATQSFVEISYGPLGLELMRAGRTAGEALASLIASDAGRAVRQVAMVDAAGRAAAHTGDGCIEHAGHQVGKRFSVQANLMERSTVWGAMARAFEQTKGDLAERMMAALEAAQAEGGDIRGQQSAAMVVVSGKPSGTRWNDTLIDIRVDDSAAPLVELRRLLDISRAYQHMNRGDELFAAGKLKRAGKEYRRAAKLVPDNPEIQFWHAVALVSVNKLDKALPIFARVFARDERWRQLVPRLVKAGLLPDDRRQNERILKQ